MSDFLRQFFRQRSSYVVAFFLLAIVLMAGARERLESSNIPESFKGFPISLVTAGLMAIGIASPVGTEIIQMTSSTAAMMVGIFALFNGAGRPLFGWLTDRITPRWAATISMVVILIASLAMTRAASGTTALYAIAFSVLWLCFGGWLAIGPTATTTYFGAKNAARNYSYVFFGYGLAAILANVIAGSSKDLFGSYTTAFVIVAVLAAIGAVIALLIWRQIQARRGGVVRR